MAFVPEPPPSAKQESHHRSFIVTTPRPRHATIEEQEGRSGVACVPSPDVFTLRSRGLRGFSPAPHLHIIITIDNGPGGKRIDSKTKF